MKATILDLWILEGFNTLRTDKELSAYGVGPLFKEGPNGNELSAVILVEDRRNGYRVFKKDDGTFGFELIVSKSQLNPGFSKS